MKEGYRRSYFNRIQNNEGMTRDEMKLLGQLIEIEEDTDSDCELPPYHNDEEIYDKYY